MFQLIPEHIQIIDALGDRSPLVAAIMEHIKVSAGGPGSYVDQALNYELPPSTHLNHDDVAAVLNAILGQGFMDLRRLCNFLDTQLSTSSTSSTTTSSVSSGVALAFKAHYDCTLYLGDKEASARGILSLFMQGVRDALQERHPNQKFFIDHEFKIFPFYSDAALIVASTGQQQKQMKAVFSLEYKPKVSPQLKDQPPFHLSELFLQAFYLAAQCEHSIVHCLTDLEDYHMSLMGKDGKKLCRKCNLTNSSQTAEHLHFLSENIPLPQEALVLFGDT